MTPTASTDNRATHTVSTSIRVDGTNVSKQLGGLLSIMIYREFNKIPTARVIFQDGAIETQTFAKSDSSSFVPGKTLDIQAGYQNDEGSLFRGVIVRHGIKMQLNKPSVLEIECKDAAVKMTLLRHSRYFYKQTDTDIFRQLISSYPGLTVGDLATTVPQHEELVQHHATDWDFLVLRAEANGLVVVVDDGKVSVVKPSVAAQATQKAVNGQTIIELEASLDGRTHWPAVQASTWDYTKQEVSNEKADAPGGGNNYFASDFYGTTPIPFYHGGDMATEQLQAWATGKQTQSTLSRMRGRVRMRGLDIRPGQTLELQHVGDRFNGNYLITGVMHQCYDGTWLTDSQLGLAVHDFAGNASDIQTPPAAGLFPGVRGLHIGVVSKIEGDTREGKHRIQVRIPYLALTDSGQQSEGIWTRLSTLYAGADRGFVFRPELGDEVVLGFINDDPNDAIILGALHSNQRAAPFDATDKNPQKGFVAKQGMRVVFDDDAKSLLLETKEGYSVFLSEKDGKLELKDKSGNSLVLNSDGITLNSTKDITIRASSNVKVEGAHIDLN